MLTQRSLDLPYSEVGGVRLDFFFIPTPHAGLVIDSKRLVITIYWIKKYIFVPGDITGIEVFHGTWGRGIKILHKRRDIPYVVVFWGSGDIHVWKYVLNSAGFGSLL